MDLLQNNDAAYELIQRMANMAEYYEVTTPLHNKRIAAYCRILAAGVGKTAEEADLISQASQLHDVGMIGVPRKIIQHGGKLTHEDWEIIKDHPLIGAGFLADSQHEIIQVAEVISRTHHERWNGSGYPRGLTGSEIPLVGQICGLADVYDSITTSRVYKSKVSPEDALELVVDSSGVFFAPSLIQIFEAKIDEINAARELNSLEEPQRP